MMSYFPILSEERFRFRTPESTKSTILVGKYTIFHGWYGISISKLIENEPFEDVFP